MSGLPKNGPYLNRESAYGVLAVLKFRRLQGLSYQQIVRERELLPRNKPMVPRCARALGQLLSGEMGLGIRRNESRD